MKVKNLSIYTGLDFGNDSVKAVCIRRTRESFACTGYSIAKYDGSDLSDPARVSAAAKKALAGVGKADKHVFISVSTATPLIRYQQLNNAPVEDIRRSLKFNSASFLNQDYSDYYLDCASLPAPAAADGKRPEKLKFLVAGAPKKDVDGVFQGIKKIKYVPVGIQLSPVSLINAYEFCRTKDFMEGVVLMVDIGHALSTVSLLYKGVPELSRVLNFGGKNITESISKEMSCDLVAAEAQKIQPSDPVKEIIKQSLGDLVKEIRASINFFEGQSGAEVKKIHLSGGTSRSAEVRENIAENIGLTAEMWNPLEGLEVNIKGSAKDTLQSDFCALGAAVGAAIEGIYQA